MFTPEQIEKSFKLTDLFGKKGWNVAKSEFSGLGEESGMNRARVPLCFCGSEEKMERERKKKEDDEQKKKESLERRNNRTETKETKTKALIYEYLAYTLVSKNLEEAVKLSRVSRSDAGNGSTLAFTL